MGITTLIPALYRAYQAGQIIREPAKWKSGQELVNHVTMVLTGIFTAIVYFYPGASEWLSDELKVLIGTLIIAVLGIANNIITRITTKKEIGLNVLLEDTKDEPNHGRREEDLKISPLERRVYGPKDLGSSSKLGSGDRKTTSQGKDVL